MARYDGGQGQLMKVLRVTHKLRRSVSALFLIIPLFIYQIYEGSNLPTHEDELEFLKPYIIGSFLIAVVFYWLLLKGYRWTFKLLKLVAVGWCLSSVVFAIVQSNFLLGVHSVVLVTYWVLTINLLKFELSRSFFDPRLSWYQSTPKPIPYLDCSISGQKENFRVSRMDSDGVFIFLDQKNLSKDFTKSLVKSKVVLDFSFKDKSVKCKGRTMTALPGGLGFGIQFTNMNSDERKELGDFVSCLQGEGFY